MMWKLLLISGLLLQIITSCAGGWSIRVDLLRPQPNRFHLVAGIYPDEPLLWKTYKLMEVIQTKAGSDGARAAMFFLALAFFFSQICVNVRVSRSKLVVCSDDLSLRFSSDRW